MNKVYKTLDKDQTQYVIDFIKNYSNSQIIRDDYWAGHFQILMKECYRFFPDISYTDQNISYIFCFNTDIIKSEISEIENDYQVFTSIYFALYFCKNILDETGLEILTYYKLKYASLL